jgi:NAD+ synthase (glutamine-hydrolysing)
VKLIQLAGAAINQTPLDWQGNLARLRKVFSQAREKNISILCLPELSITGYGQEDTFCSPFVIEKAWTLLQELIPESRSMFACVGLPVAHRGALYNCIAVLCDGKLIGLIAKKHLAGDGVHYENRWFKPWPENMLDSIEKEGQLIPMGDFHVDVNGIKIGFEICEEAWVAERPGAKLAKHGVDLILNPSASHFAFGKKKIRENFVTEGSRAFGVAYVYSNLVGNESGRIIYDGGVLIATEGKLIASGKRLSFQDVYLTSSVVDIEVNRTTRLRTASFQPSLGRDANCLKAHLIWPDVVLSHEPFQTESWEQSPNLKEEEFARAVALGLFDYLRKSYSQGFVVSLSGGVDSTVVSSLVALSFHFAIKELGMSGVKKQLAHIGAISGAQSAEEIIHTCLTCVYQATENSSVSTRTAAQKVANALGAQYHEWEISSLVSLYHQLISQTIGRPLNWETDDLALQNIQARVRAPGIWMLANLKNALLLSTSNRSEAAVGYATMDGDTCGGLSPIAGIDKAFLLKWIVWLQKHGPNGHFAIGALDSVTQLQPTAELRPAQSAQTDENDLMPYPVLDAIERAAIRDKRSPQEVFSLLQVDFPEYEASHLKVWVIRFFKLWAQNQWKRERYAPSFHLDDESLDPKTWCRFPILSGGFREELSTLQENPL